jgi:hypothetical protein
MLMQHGIAACSGSMDLQVGHAEWTCTGMDMHQGHKYVDMNMQYCIDMNMRYFIDMNMQRGHGYAASTWKCNLYMDMQYEYGHAAKAQTLTWM